MRPTTIRRRDFLPVLAAPLVLTADLGTLAAAPAPTAKLKGNIKQGVTKGVFRGAMADGKPFTFEDMCRAAAERGIQGFDLLNPDEFATAKKYGLVPSMWNAGPGGSIPDALNRTENHAKIEASLRQVIDQAGAAGVPNVITFSGNRRGQDDRVGADNTVAFLNKVKAQAEDKGVTICIELLNSKVNHKDYQFDHMSWGVDVIKRVDSPRVKILYDIYHAQIMDGNITDTIRENIYSIGHFHTGGNPGRHDIDDTQELNYGFVAREIAKLGYKGFISHEYSPAQGHDALQVLDQAIQICDA